MKFTTYISQLVTVNTWLKISVIGLGAINLLMIVVICSLAMRSPFVIDRSCRSLQLKSSDAKVTEDEVKAFIREVLPQRFDNDTAIERSFFDDGEILAKEKEQNILKEKSITQSLLPLYMEVKGDQVLVKADRKISVGDIRSILPMVLKVSLRRDSRTQSNIYGLIITKIEAINEKKDK